MTYIDRLYADVADRVAHPEGISLLVDAEDIAAAAMAAGDTGRRLGRVLHAEAIPGTALIEVVFEDRGPSGGLTTKGATPCP